MKNYHGSNYAGKVIMAKFEINGIFKFKGAHGTHYMPCGLNFVDKLWWRFVPGVVINVKWPKGFVILEEMSDGTKVGTESADPNDHYRPWLEEHVGRQGWDWNWGMGGEDATENRLTIKVRHRYAKYATIAKLNWS